MTTEASNAPDTLAPQTEPGIKIVNLMPHDLVLCAPDGTVLATIPKSGLARVSQTPGELREVPGLPVPVAAPSVMGPVTGLPEPVAGTVYVVSFMVADAVKRADVFSPGTGPNDGAIRNEQGQVSGVTRLVAYV